MQQGGGGGGGSGNAQMAPFIGMDGGAGEASVGSRRGGWQSAIGLKGGGIILGRKGPSGWPKSIGLKGGAPIFTQSSSQTSSNTTSSASQEQNQRQDAKPNSELNNSTNPLSQQGIVKAVGTTSSAAGQATYVTIVSASKSNPSPVANENVVVMAVGSGSGTPAPKTLSSSSSIAVASTNAGSSPADVVTKAASNHAESAVAAHGVANIPEDVSPSKIVSAISGTQGSLTAAPNSHGRTISSSVILQDAISSPPVGSTSAQTAVKESPSSSSPASSSSVSARGNATLQSAAALENETETGAANSKAPQDDPGKASPKPPPQPPASVLAQSLPSSMSSSSSPPSAANANNTSAAPTTTLATSGIITQPSAAVAAADQEPKDGEEKGPATSKEANPQNALLKQLLSSNSATGAQGGSVNETSTTAVGVAAVTTTTASKPRISLEAQLDKPTEFKQFQQSDHSLSSLATRLPQPQTDDNQQQHESPSTSTAKAPSQIAPTTSAPPLSQEPAQVPQKQASASTISNSNPPENEKLKIMPALPSQPIPPESCAPPNRPNQSLLNLPTEPVPHASLVQQQKIGELHGHENQQKQLGEQQKGPPQGQHVQPRQMRPMIQQQKSPAMNQPRMIGPNGGQIVRAPLPEQQLGQMQMSQQRPRLPQDPVAQNNTTSPSSHLQGLLQQQTLVPQEKLTEEAQMKQSNQQQRQQQPQQQQQTMLLQQPNQSQNSEQLVRGPPPVAQSQHMQRTPDGPLQSQQQMMQQQQQQQQHQQLLLQQQQQIRPVMAPGPGAQMIRNGNCARMPNQQPVMRIPMQQQMQMQRLRMQQSCSIPPGVAVGGMRGVPPPPEQQQMRPQFPNQGQMPLRSNVLHQPAAGGGGGAGPMGLGAPMPQGHPGAPPAGAMAVVSAAAVGGMTPRMAPPPPHMVGMGGGGGGGNAQLRLNIPPPPPQGQNAMPPLTPGTPTSQQPSPALTPRSEEGDYLDSGSSRGHTPAPGEGPSTPDSFFPNGEPPQKMVKRRPSSQQGQKRRLSQSAAGGGGGGGSGGGGGAGGAKEGLGGGNPGMGGGPSQKKRPRKGSTKTEDTDFDVYMEQISMQLKNLPPVLTQEPHLDSCYNACQIFGMGDLPRTFGFEDVDTKRGRLDGTYADPHIPDEGEYYDVLPFGPDPPVPSLRKLNSTARAFYKHEFDPDLRGMASSDGGGAVSPDLFYSSSPEPETERIMRGDGVQTPWYDLEPDSESELDESEVKKEEDEEEEEEELAPLPPKVVERATSPGIEVVKPIPIYPAPKQLVTMRVIKELLAEENLSVGGSDEMDEVALAKSKSHLPRPRSNGSLTSITMTLSGNGATKNVLRALNGIAKLLKVDAPKNWVVEDRNGFKDVLLVRNAASGKDGGCVGDEPMDLLDVLTNGRKMCRQCDSVLSDKMVKMATKDIPFMTAQEKEDHKDVYFCNSDCYFKFAVSRTNSKTVSVEVSSIEQLKEMQERHRVEQERRMKREGAGSCGGVGVPNGLDEDAQHKGKTYKNWSTMVTQAKKHKKLNDQELTKMMFSMGLTKMPPLEAEDLRECLFCHTRGDRPADGPARLLNYDVNKWVHLNCALWSEEVYETVSGALVNVETALKNGQNSCCKMCEKNGATLKCWKVRCTNSYHVACAVQDKAMFYKNKSVYCNQHIPKGEKDQELTTLAVFRRVFIDRDESRQVAKVMHQGTDQNLIRIGSLVFLSVGQLLPHQLHNFVTRNHIYPIGFKTTRFYWSIAEVNKRCAYTCSIADVENKPEFRIAINEGKENETLYTDVSAKGVWMQVLEAVDRLRREHGLVRVFPGYLTGEDLFGLTEPSIVKVLESLPGIESLNNYNFKYGANPLLELPLAVNPTGCARFEPKMRTRVKRVHNFQRTSASAAPAAAAPTVAAAPSSRPGNFGRAARENAPVLIGLEMTGPYSKNFVQSKSSQYRKMRQEWKQNVVLARSKIQGLGLYAARDLEKHQMIIEYIGEVIRASLTDIREKRYESQNRGIYMFRLDDDRVLDATMCGGMARYINHSCDPNCVTETIEVNGDFHIIIFANKRIARGAELCYDYKFDFEDENRIPCGCGAENCRKWMN